MTNPTTIDDRSRYDEATIAFDLAKQQLNDLMQSAHILGLEINTKVSRLIDTNPGISPQELSNTVIKNMQDGGVESEDLGEPLEKTSDIEFNKQTLLIARIAKAITKDNTVTMIYMGNYNPIHDTGYPGVRDFKILRDGDGSYLKSATTGSMVGLTGASIDSVQYKAIKMGGKFLHMVTFPDTRFDDRSNVSGFIIEIPETSEYHNQLKDNPAAIAWAFVTTFSKFFEAQATISNTKTPNGDKLIAAIMQALYK